MDAVTPVNPSAVVASSTDDECPGCGATAQDWTCAACGLDWACPAVHPALSIIGLLPTPALRTAAFLATLRSEVHRRSGKDPTMPVTVRLPASELYNLHSMASVDTVTWWCLLCASQGNATTQPLAWSGAIEHLTAEHHATIDTDDPE